MHIYVKSIPLFAFTGKKTKYTENRFLSMLMEHSTMVYMHVIFRTYRILFLFFCVGGLDSNFNMCVLL